MDIKGKRLRLLYSDVLGVERGKYLFGDVADSGHSAFCIGVYPLTTDKEILDISSQQFDIGLPDVEAFIDRDTLRPGWEDDTIVGIADVHREGEPLEVDPRQVLRKAVEPWRRWASSRCSRSSRSSTCSSPATRAAGRRSTCRRTASTGPACPSTPTGRSTRWSRRPCAAASPSESWSSEFDIAAYEVNIKYKEAIGAADECFLFRLLVKEIAAKNGKLATFMGRPFNDRGGSGLHLNFSLRREDGSNAFDDPNAPDGLAPIAGSASRACSRTTRACRRSRPRTRTRTSASSPTC